MYFFDMREMVLMKKIKISFIIIVIFVFSISCVFAAKYKGDMDNNNTIDIFDIRLMLQKYIDTNRKNKFK